MSRSLPSILGVKFVPIMAWKPEIAPQAMVIKIRQHWAADHGGHRR